MSDDKKVSLETVETVNISSVPEGRGAHNSFWLDFGPLLVFFVGFHWVKRTRPDDAMLIAAGIFAVAAVAALVIGWGRHKKVSGMLVLSTAIIVITAALALLANNKIIFYMKPTIVNILFGVAAIVGVLMGKNIIRLMIGSAFTLPDRIWDMLAIRWGLFFFAMAVLNEFIWRTQSEEFWVNFKVFGFLPLTIVFTLTMIPLINRHGGLDGLKKRKDG